MRQLVCWILPLLTLAFAESKVNANASADEGVD